MIVVDQLVGLLVERLELDSIVVLQATMAGFELGSIV